MRPVFADADYLIAQLNPQEELHARSKAASAKLRNVRIVTTEMVLTEVLAFYADKGSHLRKTTAALIDSLRENPDVTVVPQSSGQFQEALSLYRQRPDKQWSLTDCASFQVMQKQKIAEALTQAVHFQQAGFKALLRDAI